MPKNFKVGDRVVPITNKCHHSLPSEVFEDIMKGAKAIVSEHEIEMCTNIGNGLLEHIFFDVEDHRDFVMNHTDLRLYKRSIIVIKTKRGLKNG